MEAIRIAVVHLLPWSHSDGWEHLHYWQWPMLCIQAFFSCWELVWLNTCPRDSSIYPFPSCCVAELHNDIFPSVKVTCRPSVKSSSQWPTNLFVVQHDDRVNSQLTLKVGHYERTRGWACGIQAQQLGCCLWQVHSPGTWFWNFPQETPQCFCSDCGVWGAGNSFYTNPGVLTAQPGNLKASSMLRFKTDFGW